MLTVSLGGSSANTDFEILMGDVLAGILILNDVTTQHPGDFLDLPQDTSYTGAMPSRAYRSSCSRFGAINPDIQPHAALPQKCLVLVTK